MEAEKDAMITSKALTSNRRRALQSDGSREPARTLVKKKQKRNIIDRGLKLLWSLGFGVWCAGSALAAGDGLSLAWTNNLLTISSSTLPGGKLDIWYLEA